MDNALSPAVAVGLQKAGYNALHVRDCGIQHVDDEEIFERASQEDRILVSADTHFWHTSGLAGKGKRPSVILFRRVSQRHPQAQVSLLLANLPELSEALQAGCVAVFEEGRIRLRPLPIGRVRQPKL